MAASGRCRLSEPVDVARPSGESYTIPSGSLLRNSNDGVPKRRRVATVPKVMIGGPSDDEQVTA